MLRKLHTIKLTFWQQWLLHSFVLWVILGTYMYFDYWGITRKNSYMLHEDNEPVTYWVFFYNHVVLGLAPGVFFVVYYVEATYHFFYKKLEKKYLVLGSLLLVAFLILTVFTIYQNYTKGYENSGFIKGLFGMFFVSCIYTYIYCGVRQSITNRIDSAEEQSEKSKAELNALKAQVNPHFFFNTLNSLYGTALEEKAARTAECVDQLAGIMRYTMNEAQQDLTPIAREISFLEDYLHLQRLRLPTRKNREIVSEIEYDGTPALIAPMLLIPFIENAFKYGMSVDQECWVHLHLKVENQELHLRIENKLIRESAIAKGQGTGIENARKRLLLLYPDKHQLLIEQNDTFKVELSLQLQQAEETVSLA